MEALDIKTTNETVVVTFDKSYFDDVYLRNLLTRLRTEYLIQKADFGESIEELGNEIKRNWWQNNKSKYIQE